MILKRFDYKLSVCKINSVDYLDLNKEFYFFSKTDEEISLVCQTKDVPDFTIAREDGWKAFRVEGILDFSLVGILAKISGILAENGISIFAVSTFNTDYVLVKEENFDRAYNLLIDLNI